MVRKATENDSERILEMGLRFLHEGPYRDELGDCEEQSKRLCALLFKDPRARILVSEQDGKVQGIFCFIVFSHYYSGEITANELIWYVEPEARKGGEGLRLLSEAERLAREYGASRMQLTAPTEAVGKLYGRCGYHQVEVCFQRTL